MNEIENTLRSLLRNNIVAFTFKKVDGTIRHALGTRNLSLAERYTETKIPTPTGDMQPNSYYDVERGGWRSWKEGNVINIDGYAPVEKFSREIPVQKGIEVELPPSFGSGTADKIRKEIEKLGKEIVFGCGVPMGGFGGGMPTGGGVKGELPSRNGKVGMPMDTGYGVAIPISGVGGGKEMTIEDFAKLVAKFVVAELVDRLTK